VTTAPWLRMCFRRTLVADLDTLQSLPSSRPRAQTQAKVRFRCGYTDLMMIVSVRVLAVATVPPLPASASTRTARRSSLRSPRLKWLTLGTESRDDGVWFTCNVCIQKPQDGMSIWNCGFSKSDNPIASESNTPCCHWLILCALNRDLSFSPLFFFNFFLLFPCLSPFSSLDMLSVFLPASILIGFLPLCASS
jgi:hypothetical protein